MSCGHHWTVTSECPKCLRAEVEALQEQLRLSSISEFNAIAEANDLRAEVEALHKLIADAHRQHGACRTGACTACDAKVKLAALAAGTRSIK